MDTTSKLHKVDIINIIKYFFFKEHRGSDTTIANIPENVLAIYDPEIYNATSHRYGKKIVKTFI